MGVSYKATVIFYTWYDNSNKTKKELIEMIEKLDDKLREKDMILVLGLSPKKFLNTDYLYWDDDLDTDPKTEKILSSSGFYMGLDISYSNYKGSEGSKEINFPLQEINLLLVECNLTLSDVKILIDADISD